MSPAKKGGGYAKRADRNNLFFAVAAVVLVVVLALLMYFGNQAKKINGTSPRTQTRVIMDIYESTISLEKKMAEEKAAHAKSGSEASSRDKDVLEVSMEEQLSSMNEKLRQLREQKTVEESQAAETTVVKDKKPEPAPMESLSPLKPENFSAPLEFNNMLAKPLKPSQ